jgi:hypothetical protein
MLRGHFGVDREVLAQLLPWGHFAIVGEVLARLLLGGYIRINGEVLVLPPQEGLHEAMAHTGIVFFPSGQLHRAG